MGLNKIMREAEVFNDVIYVHAVLSWYCAFLRDSESPVDYRSGTAMYPWDFGMLNNAIWKERKRETQSALGSLLLFYTKKHQFSSFFKRNLYW